MNAQSTFPVLYPAQTFWFRNRKDMSSWLWSNRHLIMMKKPRSINTPQGSTKGFWVQFAPDSFYAVLFG